jgi:hypothetical protein
MLARSRARLQAESDRRQEVETTQLAGPETHGPGSPSAPSRADTRPPARSIWPMPVRVALALSAALVLALFVWAGFNSGWLRSEPINPSPAPTANGARATPVLTVVAAFRATEPPVVAATPGGAPAA